VLCFSVRTNFLVTSDVHTVGGRSHRDYWIPAEQLTDFDAAIVGPIEVIQQFVGGLPG